MKSQSLYDKKLYRCVVLLLAVSLNVFLIGYLLVDHEWAFNADIGPTLVKAGRFAILIACESSCLFIWLLIAMFGFFISFERFYDTESLEDMSVVFNIKGISSLFLFGFLCCFGYDIYHLNKWSEIASALLALSLCVDFAWIISLVSHYNQSDDNRFVDYGKYDKHKYNRVSKGTHIACFFILMLFTLASKTICNEGAKFIINSRASEDQEHIQNIADSVWAAYMDVKSGKISSDDWAETYDELCAGTDLVSWNDPGNEIKKQIIDSCRDDIDSIIVADGTPKIFVQIKDNKVYAELMNPNKIIAEYARFKLTAQKAFLDTPPILFLYHAYDKDKKSVDYNMVIDCYGNTYEIIDNTVTENGFEKLNDAWMESRTDTYPSISPAVNEETEPVIPYVSMFKAGDVDLYDLYEYYDYYLLSINANKLYTDDRLPKPDYFDIYNVEIYAFRYNEHMDIEYDLIYLRERERYYLNKSQAIDMVTSWIIKNSGQRYF